MVHAARKILCVNVGSMTGCPFCGVQESLLAENDHAIAPADKHPISKGHSLIIPRQHVPSIFDLSSEEYVGCFDLVRTVRQLLERKYSPAGFNLAVNDGRAAGQTVAHAHVHVVPRYPGDCLKPNNLLREFLAGPGTQPQ